MQAPEQHPWFKGPLRSDAEAPVRKVAPEQGRAGARRIRCPRCQWQPRASDLWGCVCGHSWNTFDTAGVCPSCRLRWLVTQCLSCKEFSPHEEWYQPTDPEGKR